MSGGKQFNGKTFCTLPFLHLATHPIGTVTPCCVTDMRDDMSTAKKDGFNLFLGKDSLDDIINSTTFKDIRKQMINGDIPEACMNCFKQEQQGIKSKRQESNDKFKKQIENCFLNTNTDGSLKKLDFRYLELRLGSVCNLKCSTCNSFSSNKWNEDVSIFKDTKFSKYHFKNDIKTEWYRDSQFYDELFSNCNELEEIWINGGEPTLIREHEYFLNKLIDNESSKHISLNYSINLTSLPEHLIEKWKKFKKVNLQLSIDDIGERNSYIRYPSNWDTIYQNLLRINDESNIFTLQIMQSVSLYNVVKIDEFKKFTENIGIHVAHNYVNYPEFFHVSLLPDELKTKILDESINLKEYEIDKLKFEFSKPHENITLDDFIEFVKLLDNKRKTNIKDTLHEWRNYF